MRRADAVEVDLHAPAEVVDADLFERPDVTQPGIVYEDVQPPVPGLDGAHRRRAGTFVCDVELHDLELDARILRSSSEPLGRRGGANRRHHRVTGPREGNRRSKADPAPRTRDHHDPPVPGNPRIRHVLATVPVESTTVSGFSTVRKCSGMSFTIHRPYFLRPSEPGHRGVRKPRP